ncbi:MAG: rhodanese-like domain-containing protein [Acidobacteriota bacterium]
MILRQIFDPHLAQYAYLVGCPRSGEALLIDPQRDIDRYLDEVARAGLRLTAVAETHIHADFLTGTRELAMAGGVTAYLSAEGGDEWQYEWARGGSVAVHLLHHGDRFRLGGVELQALHTPGHTPEHLSFAITDRGAGATTPWGLLSGDFVFAGDLGRPDLLESAAGAAGAAQTSARQLYGSLDTLRELPEFLQVWPGHGAGSACGKALGAVPSSTIGYELRCNPAIAAAGEGEEAFVRAMVDGHAAPPLYFGRMKRLNRLGPPALPELPRPIPLEASQVAAEGARGAAVLDTRRDRAAFMAGHLPNSLWTPWNNTFPTLAGCYVEPDQEIFLVIDEDHLDAAVRNLVRVGLDRVRGWCSPASLPAEGARLEVIDFDQAVERQARGSHLVVDVRRRDEYAAGHLAGALHIPHTRLAAELDRIPRQRPLMVHCASGIRAAAACSLLARQGYRVAHVDDRFQRLPASAVEPIG